MDEREKRHQALRALDAAHVWHPFTQMAGWVEEDPLIVERGEGCYLEDVRGKRYLDGISSLWCNVHGHRVPEIDQAIRDQLDRVAHSTLLGQAGVPSIELAARLASVAPEGLTRVFYSDAGSTAVEVAVKMAFQYWRHQGNEKKRYFVSLGEAYHGDTLGSVSLGRVDAFHRIFDPLLFETLTIPTPHGFRPPPGHTPESWGEHCTREAEALLDSRGEEIVALVIEPMIQGAAGMLTQPKGYLARLAAACKRNDVLLICDEVATGFGRTGTMWAVEQEGVRPDLMTVAKGLTGGYLPLAATLTTDRIFEAFLGSHESRRTFFHGHTYTGNALACASALASLDLFEKNRVIEGLQPKIAYLRERMAALATHPHVGEVRQRGMMVGIELVADKASLAPYPPAMRVGHRVILHARELGVILRPLGDVIVLMPPLAISMEELEILCDAASRSIEAVTRKLE